MTLAASRKRRDKFAPTSGAAEYFNAVAEVYASRYDEDSPGGWALRVRRQRVLEALEVPPGRMLDVGCGPGLMAGDLIDKGWEFWGVDASPRMITECHKQFGSTQGAHFSTGSITSLDFPDEFFDAVICMGVIDRIQADELAIQEMSRVVKRHGILLISFANLLSPYAAWKNFFFYPAVGLLRPVYYGVAGRRPPPSLPLSFARLYTARSAAALMAKYGAEVSDVDYFYFNVFLSPLDELLPGWTLRLTQKLERLRCSKLKWLAVGFVLKAEKR
ncbi:MAG: class I SAM-dependent methyltransferase [Acidobacteria bacterium]|nr:class I SAM-dependent methyltransferase [Acidobacteriota bacterium]